jgi:capsular exopolysaccharide synthesis family protein
MSRIFDALQRTGIEQSGVKYPDLVSIVTQVLEAPALTAPFRDEPVLREEVTSQRSAEENQVVELPHIDEDERKPYSEVLADFPTLNVTPNPSTRLVCITEPDSLAAEKFRFLGVRLKNLQKSRLFKKVLVTSTIPEEGKSLVSANLAAVLAKRKKRVLLIDGDLRRPVLAKQFGLGELAGLAQWLQGDRRSLSNIYYLSELGFWLMPAGSVPENPIELMSSTALGQMMERLSELFDWIIVDSPPILPLADTTVWARVTDGILLVARVGKTEKAQLKRGLEIIKKSDIIGVVLNGSEHTSRDYYARYVAKAGLKPNNVVFPDVV